MEAKQRQLFCSIHLAAFATGPAAVQHPLERTCGAFSVLMAGKPVLLAHWILVFEKTAPHIYSSPPPQRAFSKNKSPILDRFCFLLSETLQKAGSSALLWTRVALEERGVGGGRHGRGDLLLRVGLSVRLSFCLSVCLSVCPDLQRAAADAVRHSLCTSRFPRGSAHQSPFPRLLPSLDPAPSLATFQFL